jgi:glutathione S-transferase
MLTLYYSPGACSMASHIVLEEVGAEYEPRLVSLAKGEHLTPEYKKINPRSKVPALMLEDGGILVENTAIVSFLARRHPEKKLLPADELGRARCVAMCTWFSNTVHPAFGRWYRPERFTADAAGQAAVKESGKAAFWAGLQEIDAMIGDDPWVMGGAYTVVDPYALVFYGWGPRLDLPMAELKRLTAWKDRMLQRAAVRRILEREKSPLLAA